MLLPLHRTALVGSAHAVCMLCAQTIGFAQGQVEGKSEGAHATDMMARKEVYTTSYEGGTAQVRHKA